MVTQQFKERLKEYFTFTRKERNGIFMLLVFIFILQGAIIYTHYSGFSINNSDSPSSLKEMLDFEKALAAMEKPDSFAFNNQQQFVSTSKEESGSISYQQFDPNTITAPEWKKMGVNEKASLSILHYLNKGGRFRKKEDLKKIYTLSSTEYERLQPYILILDSVPEIKYQDNKVYLSRTKTVALVEVNAASKEELMTLPMIGEKRAEQIIKYRDLLGGFVVEDQLKEVYSIPDSVYQLIKSKITINNSLIKHIHINSDSISSLKHFYITKPIARLIVNYRLQHGAYKSVEDIKKLPLITDSLFGKIEHYLMAD